MALYYKQLKEVERGWRDQKHILDLRPIYHRKEERIRAHVLLSFLALLLTRVAETRAHDTGATAPRAQALARLERGLAAYPSRAPLSPARRERRRMRLSLRGSATRRRYPGPRSS